MSNLLFLLVKCGKEQHCKFLGKERKSEEQKEGRGEQGREKERWKEEKGDFLELFLVSYFSFRQCGIGHWCYTLYPSNSESFLNLKLLRKQNLKVHVPPEERIDYLELFAYYFFLIYSILTQIQSLVPFLHLTHLCNKAMVVPGTFHLNVPLETSLLVQAGSC